MRTEKGTPAGKYSGTVTLTTSIGTFEMPMNVTVYDVVVPDADESDYVNIGWIHPEATVDYAWSYRIGSNVWWQVMEEYAAAMGRDRITNVTIPVLDLLAAAETKVDGNGKFTFNWSIVDRYIELFLSKGNFNMLENLSSLISGTFGGGAPAAHILRGDASGYTVVTTAGVFSDEAENFMSQYLPALEAHLKEKGWHDMWYQYIGDEPTAAVVASWTHAYDNWLKKYTTLKCHCAFGWADSVVEMLTDRVDMWVPLISSYDGRLEFFADRVANHGEKVINYTCTVPQGKYINRFIDGTYTRTRILHWYNYLTDCTGTLHWGYDYWMWGQDLANSPGDICIVYADENYKLKQSIRGALLRDGIEEYEVFFMLAQRDEKKADALVSQVVTNATTFVEDDPAKMQEIRIQALEALAGKGYSVAGTVYGDGDVTADKDRVNKGDSVKFTVSGKPTKVTVTVGGKTVNPTVSGNTYTVKNVNGPVVLHAAYGNEPAAEDISKFDPKPSQGSSSSTPTTTKPVIPTNPGDNNPEQATDNGLDGYLRVDAASGVIVLGSLGEENVLTVSSATVSADSETAIKAVSEKFTLIKVELASAAVAQVQLPLPEGYVGSRCKVLLVTADDLVDLGAVAYDGKLAFTTDTYGVFAVVETPKVVTPGNDGKDGPSDPDTSMPETDDTVADDSNLLWLWIVLGVVAAAGVAVVVVLLVKKSKKGGAA